MWVVFAFLSAFFSGITAILAKCGIHETDSAVATALRTIVVFIFSWLLAMFKGSLTEITKLSSTTWIFLILSGIATGASWLCYFYALQKGDVNKVVPIDKSSTVMSVLLAFFILKESFSGITAFSVIMIAAGTFMMIQRNRIERRMLYGPWLVAAVLSAVFAALTSILGKIGIAGVDSDLGTAIRTTVVLAMSWLVVGVEGKSGLVRNIKKKELMFIFLSGMATGCAWLCYYRALQKGPASIVVPIDKLSIVVTIIFSRVVFKEKLSLKSLTGLSFIIAGTLLMLV